MAVAAEEPEMPTLPQLPIAVMGLITARTGSRGIAAAACACRGLRDVKTQLAGQRVFASASSGHPDLVLALREATTRALEGMLGSVDFVVFITSGYVLEEHTGDLVTPLQTLLPPGTPVVGAHTDGVSGPGPDGVLQEYGYDLQVPQGVVVLLGRLPGVSVRPFVDMKATNSPAPMSVKLMRALTSLDTWLGPVPGGDPDPAAGCAAVHPDALWLWSACIFDVEQQWLEVLTGQPLPFQLQGTQAWQDRPLRVLAGGRVQRGSTFTFAPGKWAPLVQNWDGASSRVLKRAAFAGLAFCPLGDRNPGLGPSAPRPAAQASVAAAGATFRGLAPVLAGDELCPVFRGCILEVDQTSDLPPFSLLVTVAGGEMAPTSPTGAPPRGSNDDGWVDFARTSGRTLQDMSALLWYNSLNPHCAVWRADDVARAGLPSDWCTPELLSSGHVVLLPAWDSQEQEEEAPGDCIASVVPWEQWDRLKRIMVGGREHVRAQLLETNVAALTGQLPRLARTLHTALTAVTPHGARGVPWDALALARENAQAHGVRCGPCALAVFSCNGRVELWRPGEEDGYRRGKADKAPVTEAKCIDQALSSGVPVLYGLYGGELGPDAPSGCWAGVSATPAVLCKLPPPPPPPPA